jgi:hypothetical protein
MKNLIVGEQITLTAALTDGNGNPVPVADPTRIRWEVQEPHCVTLALGEVRSGERHHEPARASGPTAYVVGVKIGTCNVVAKYWNGATTYQSVTQCVVGPNAVANINVS